MATNSNPQCGAEALRENLPEDVSNLPIDYLPMEKPSYNALCHGGKIRIGQVYTAIQEKEPITNIGESYKNHLIEVFTKLFDVIHRDGTIDWENFWESYGIGIIPVKSQVYSTDEQRISDLPEIIKQILYKDSGEPGKEWQKWQVISSRFQLAGTGWMTLESLGQKLVLSGERIRQLQQSALETLGDVFVRRKYPGKHYRLRRDFALAVWRLLDDIPEDKFEQNESRIERLLYLISERTSQNNDEDYSSEDQERVTKVRTRPDIFRERVLENFKGQCCLSGISETDLLEAPHIVPYAVRKDTRQDPRNGLCLVATYHKLFDKGYITFDDDLTVRITRRHLEFSKPLQELLLSLDGRKASKPLIPISSEYLDYHRRKVFKG